MVARGAIGADWSYLKAREAFLPRGLVLELAVRAAHLIPGNIVEFGVAEGHSTRVLRRALTRCERGQVLGQRKKLFACDSFKGLAEKFENAEVGTFACESPNIRGVEIVEGYFQDSLTPELARRVSQVSLASLDADLYSSTLCALRWLSPLLHTGSLLLFDEFLGENESEKRAFEQWAKETGICTVQIAEFLRDPSGWGTNVDKRVLFQVIGSDVLQKRRVVSIGRLLRRYWGIARQVKNLVTQSRAL